MIHLLLITLPHHAAATPKSKSRRSADDAEDGKEGEGSSVRDLSEMGFQLDIRRNLQR